MILVKSQANFYFLCQLLLQKWKTQISNKCVTRNKVSKFVQVDANWKCIACDIMQVLDKLLMYEKIGYMPKSINGMEHLGFLTVININRDTELDYQEIAKQLFELHSVKINENNLCLN